MRDRIIVRVLNLYMEGMCCEVQSTVYLCRLTVKLQPKTDEMSKLCKALQLQSLSFPLLGSYWYLDTDNNNLCGGVKSV